jgi:hypothetical protein
VRELHQDLKNCGVESGFARMAWDLKADFDRHHLAEVIDPSRMFDHLLTAKGLWAGKVGKTGTIGAISHKNAANVSMIKPRGRGGTAQISFSSRLHVFPFSAVFIRRGVRDVRAPIVRMQSPANCGRPRSRRR